MTHDERIIELLEENNRLLTALVAPVTALQSEQLAKAGIENQKAASKAVAKVLRDQMKTGRRK